MNNLNNSLQSKLGVLNASTEVKFTEQGKTVNALNHQIRKIINFFHEARTVFEKTVSKADAKKTTIADHVKTFFTEKHKLTKDFNNKKSERKVTESSVSVLNNTQKQPDSKIEPSEIIEKLNQLIQVVKNLNSGTKLRLNEDGTYQIKDFENHSNLFSLHRKSKETLNTILNQVDFALSEGLINETTVLRDLLDTIRKSEWGGKFIEKDLEEKMMACYNKMLSSELETTPKMNQEEFEQKMITIKAFLTAIEAELEVNPSALSMSTVVHLPIEAGEEKWIKPQLNPQTEIKQTPNIKMSDFLREFGSVMKSCPEDAKSIAELKKMLETWSSLSGSGEISFSDPILKSSAQVLESFSKPSVKAKEDEFLINHLIETNQHESFSPDKLKLKLLLNTTAAKDVDPATLAKNGIITQTNLVYAYKQVMSTKDLFASISLILSNPETPKNVKEDMVGLFKLWIKTGTYLNDLNKEPDLKTSFNEVLKLSKEIMRQDEEINRIPEAKDEIETEKKEPTKTEFTAEDYDRLVKEESVNEFVDYLKLLSQEIANFDMSNCFVKDKNKVFLDYTKLFNNLTMLNIETILKKESLDEAKKTITFFIKVMDACVKTNDLSSANLIYVVLSSSSISRLFADDKTIQKQLEKFDSLFDITPKNVTNLRNKLEDIKDNPHTTPLSLFSKDLFLIDEGNKDKINEQFNIKKLNLISKSLQEIENARKSAAQFLEGANKNSKFYEYVLSSNDVKMDEETARKHYASSVRLKPRQ